MTDSSTLQVGFEQFVAAARDLERSYAELKERAAQVDLQLQTTNRALATALAEREAIVAALPLGLLTVARDGTVRCCNQEAERLMLAASAAGVVLATQPVGEVAVGDGLVRVRRAVLPDAELVLLEDRSVVQELAREVHRLDRLAGLSELALGIAHEIKNPLNGVMGFAALLERCQEPHAAQRYAGKVVQGVRQVDEIVKSLLGFARPDRKRARTATLAELAADAALAAGLPASRLRLTGGEQRADADALVRVLTNLFRNSLEASPAVHVTLRAEVRQGRLEILVADDGPGVPAALGRSVLEPFVSTKERGTGLGLSLSLRVLSYLGGDLELVNPGERGATFRIRLPLAAGTASAQEVSA